MEEQFVLTHPSLFGIFSAGCYYGCATYLFIHQLILKRNRLQQWMLWLLAVLFVVNNICLCNYYGTNIFGSRLYYDTNMLQLMMVPGMTLLICEAVRPRYVTWPKVVLCILPFAAIWALSTVFDVEVMMYLDEAFTVLFIIGAIAWGMKALRRYHENLYAQYSNIDGRDLWWLTIIMGEIFALLVVWMVADYFTTDTGNALYNIVSCVIWYTLAFFVNRQKIIEFHDAPSDGGESQKPGLCTVASVSLPSGSKMAESKAIECGAAEKEKASKQTETQKYHFADELKKIIEKERHYLDADLCLNELAQRLHTNRTYISQYLNNEMHTTFYDYINMLRIRHAVRLLHETDDKIEVVAMMSGYNNVSTFRRIFSQQMGCSASEYRKKRILASASLP